ncbi:hypothetical protein RDABS01_002698 [Bienertia sinuspersici]
MEIITTSMMDYEVGHIDKKRDEKKEGDGFDYKQAEILRKVMEECDLVDLGYMGYEYTWSSGRSGTDNVQERLDRFLANKLWRGTFPSSLVNHLPKRKSDHLRIILNIRGPRNRVKEKKKVKLFRFEEMWLKELSCEDIVKQSWNINADCRTKLNATALNLKAWSRETFGNGAKEIWEDPWIPTRPGFKAPEGCPENENNLTRVSDLLEEDGWNHERVTTVFPNEVAREILKIQVPVYPQRDSWTWLYSKDGFYSVRSAYYIQL